MYLLQARVECETKLNEFSSDDMKRFRYWCIILQSYFELNGLTYVLASPMPTPVVSRHFGKVAATYFVICKKKKQNKVSKVYKYA